MLQSESARRRGLGLDEFMDQLIDGHGLHEFDLMGFMSMVAQNVASFALARKLKERNPGLITVRGEPIVTPAWAM